MLAGAGSGKNDGSRCSAVASCRARLGEGAVTSEIFLFRLPGISPWGETSYVQKKSRRNNGRCNVHWILDRSRLAIPAAM